MTSGRDENFITHEVASLRVPVSILPKFITSPIYIKVSPPVDRSNFTLLLNQLKRFCHNKAALQYSSVCSTMLHAAIRNLVKLTPDINERAGLTNEGHADNVEIMYLSACKR